MCGIIGILGRESVSASLVEGLRRLEYRGYDSAGIAVLHDGTIKRCRAKGKIVNLENKLAEKHIDGVVGIGHTRWATHGAPNEENAHPHATDDVVVVHNGIIENFLELRRELEGEGHVFVTETDTEVIPQIITYYLKQGLAPRDAMKKAVSRLEGAYAIAALFATEDDLLAVARHGSPLAIGYGDGEMYIGSDAIALAPLTSEISYLNDGDVGFISSQGVELFDEGGEPAEREIIRSSVSEMSIGKEHYRHFMQKEIAEQPSVMGDLLHAYCNAHAGTINLPRLPFDESKLRSITLIACGTSYYASLVAKYWFERYVGLPVSIDIASEYRYRDAPMQEGGLVIGVSQSGETADTLAALRHAKKQGQYTLAIVNVTESSMAREADAVLPIYSGPEIGVASTKAFTSQLMTLALLALHVSQKVGNVEDEQLHAIVRQLSELPTRLADVLQLEEQIAEIAHELTLAKDILYIGRGTSYGIALEGALKLKEISYIHAEAIAAGELKHGTIALIDEDVPVVVIAPHDRLFEKTASNVREVAARGGKVVLISNERGCAALNDVTAEAICLPTLSDDAAMDFIHPIIYALPVQLLAYHVAVLKGTDVDQPRNLAKSVTVE